MQNYMQKSHVGAKEFCAFKSSGPVITPGVQILPAATKMFIFDCIFIISFEFITTVLFTSTARWYRSNPYSQTINWTRNSEHLVANENKTVDISMMTVFVYYINFCRILDSFWWPWRYRYRWRKDLDLYLAWLFLDLVLCYPNTVNPSSDDQKWENKYSKVSEMALGQIFSSSQFWSSGGDILNKSLSGFSDFLSTKIL